MENEKSTLTASVSSRASGVDIDVRFGSAYVTTIPWSGYQPPTQEDVDNLVAAKLAKVFDA